jgi:anti-sigma factor RsiW
VVQDVIAAHLRALVGDRITDVSSSDSHTVKPWFNGRVEVAPPVTDLTAEGYPLVGGRLDFVDGRRAAALVYRRRQHVISLFAWPSADAPADPAEALGYNLVNWSEGGVAYAAISDLNRDDLAHFAELVRARAAGEQR